MVIIKLCLETAHLKRPISYLLQLADLFPHVVLLSGLLLLRPLQGHPQVCHLHHPEGEVKLVEVHQNHPSKLGNNVGL